MTRRSPLCLTLRHHFIRYVQQVAKTLEAESCRALEIERLEPVSQANGQAALGYENSPTSVLGGREALRFHQG